MARPSANRREQTRQLRLHILHGIRLDSPVVIKHNGSHAVWSCGNTITLCGDALHLGDTKL